MAIRSFFFNAMPTAEGWDREYNAENMSDYLNLIVGSGVFPNPSTNLQVMASSGMNVIVKAGSGWINGKKIENTTDLSLTIDSSDVLLNRIDRVIFYLDYDAREMGIDVLKGTLAQNPTPPELTRNSTRVEYCLANISIEKQTTEITQADITDTRADSTICGWVAGLIQQVDTSTLFLQWEAAYNAYYAQNKEYFDNYYAVVKQELDDFMDTLTETLKVNTYFMGYKQESVITSSSTYTTDGDYKIYNIPITIQSYEYELSDVIDVYINGLKGINNTNYVLHMNTSGQSSIDIKFLDVATINNEISIEIFKTKIGIEQMTGN